MKSSVEFGLVIDRLTARLDELESRVAALEHPSMPPLSNVSARASTPMLEQHPLAQVSRPPNLMPVIGKIFLGMAGAYLLRAVAESSAIPAMAVVCAALAYAASWVLWAARTSSQANFASTAYASIAALILPLMLWELTLRFKLMPPHVAAGVLVGFVGWAAALAWKRRLASVVWAPSISAALAAVVLMLGTRHPLPFIVALLLIALITEGAALSDRWPGLRPLVAIPVNLGMLALIAIYTSANNVPPDYQPISAGVLLWIFPAVLVIYGASILSKTVPFRRNISGFDIGQLVSVFLLASFGVLRVTHYAAAIGLGIICLLVAGVYYWWALTRFETPDLRRNYYVFSSWAIALAITGGLLAFPPAMNALWLGIAAFTAVWFGAHSRRFSLAVHGLIYLAVMAVVSGLLPYCWAMLIREPYAISWPVWACYIFMLLCCALLWRGFEPIITAPQWQQKALRLVFTMASCATLAIAMAAALVAFPSASAAQVAGLRTVVICLFALLLGWNGSRWRRAELLWLAYAFIAGCTLKLLAEDLRTGSAGVIAFSLFCYGMVWLLVPRLARSAKS